MARYLALDWDHNILHVVTATVGPGGARIERAALWQETNSPNPADAEVLGRLLRERLKEARIAPAPVLAVVGRDRVILKEVHFPNVPDSEVPALVRFQAAKELTEAVDEVVIDYVIQEAPGPNGEKVAQAVILRKELLTTYQALCKAAGLKLVAVSTRPLGSIATLKRVAGTTVLTPPPEAGTAAAILTVTEKWAEFCIVRDELTIQTRFLPVSANLAGEVRRNLAVYNGQWPQHPVKALYLTGGGEHAALHERLKELLTVGVYFLDPFGGQEGTDVPATNRGGFAGAAGLLYARAHRHGLPINFVKPKQPKPPRDPNRRRLVLGAGVAAAAAAAIVIICMAQLASAQVTLDALVQEKTHLDRQLLQIEEDARRIKALEDWSSSEIAWLDELYDLTDRFPEPTTIRLVRVQCDPVVRTTRGGKYAAKMVLTGITIDDFHPVDELVSQLVSDPHYRVGPMTPTRNNGPDRLQRFTQQFTLPLDVERQSSEKYKRLLSVAPPEEETPKERITPRVEFSFPEGPGGQP